MNFSDRLADAVRAKKTPLCVGVDPRWESLPRSIREAHFDGTLEGIARGYEAFGLRILDLVGDLVPVIKPQSAFFEACGPAGMRAMQRILQTARERGIITILDAKRGDIASTATAYADAAFAGMIYQNETFPVWQADSLTVNPYLGRDAMEPFLQSARKSACGLFVLVRTSNAGAGLFQDLICEGKPLYQHVAERVREWNGENLGSCGLGDVGAVVGATHPQELVQLRALLPDVWFLIPGFGSQGGKAEEVLLGLRSDGLGAIINSSRGIIFDFHPDDPNWEAGVLKAIATSIESLRR